jgi:hypothetical protein
MVMAATGSRTLKLSILAETKQLTDSLKSANNDVETFGDKMGEVGKKIGAAFALAAAAAGAYAIKLGVDGVKSAIEDEAAQVRLASALKSATGATDTQIKATEAYISKMQLATGVSDTDLRASMQRLAVSTKDVSKSQDILNLAIDVSKGTGKDLATVTEALAKAYEGQDTKLARLGIGLSAADLKAMDFTQTQVALSNLYGGAASRNAETFQGRIDRLKQAFDEGKEAVGARLLPIIERLIGYLFEYGVPIINKFKDAWDVVKKSIDNNKENFQEFIDLMQTYVLPVLKTVFGFLIDVGAKAASAIISAFGTIAGAITPTLNFIIDGINTVIRGLNIVKIGTDIGYINKIGQPSSNFTYNSGNPNPTATSTPTITIPTPSSGGAGGGGSSTIKVPVAPAIDYSINPTLPNGMLDLNAPQNAASARLQAQADAYFAANPNIDRMTGANITVNIGVAGDPEATARAIVDTVNNSNYRGTGGANRFAFLD